MILIQDDCAKGPTFVRKDWDSTDLALYKMLFHDIKDSLLPTRLC